MALDQGNTIVVGRSMIALGTNNGGWPNSLFRTSQATQLLSCLPSDLQAVIKTVTKYSGLGTAANTIVSSSDKIFIPSEFEVKGTTDCSAAVERDYQQQYTWYLSHSPVKYYQTSRIDNWTRSLYSENLYMNDYCMIGSTGNSTY